MSGGQVEATVVRVPSRPPLSARPTQDEASYGGQTRTGPSENVSPEADSRTTRESSRSPRRPGADVDHESAAADQLVRLSCSADRRLFQGLLRRRATGCSCNPGWGAVQVRDLYGLRPAIEILQRTEVEAGDGPVPLPEVKTSAGLGTDGPADVPAPGVVSGTPARATRPAEEGETLVGTTTHAWSMSNDSPVDRTGGSTIYNLADQNARRNPAPATRTGTRLPRRTTPRG